MAISPESKQTCFVGGCNYPEGECSGECGRPTKAVREGDQPLPTPNDKPAIWPIVMGEMQARHELGIKRYGTPLQPNNGRDMLRDAYEEVLDLAVYLRGAIYERDGK